MTDSDKFDEDFDNWFDDDKTQGRFYCGQFSDKDIAYAAAYWARRYMINQMNSKKEEN